MQINETPPQYNIEDFIEIEDFASLETFISNFTSISFINFGNLPGLTYMEIISHPNFTTANLSGLDNLETFDIGGTNLEYIKLPTSNTLNLFNCSSTNLTTLDLSPFTNLTFASLLNNSLTILNIANGNKTNITHFSTTSNPDLTCILVDDIAYSEANWTFIEPITEFVDTLEDCPGLLPLSSPTLPETSLFPNPARDYFKINEDIPNLKNVSIFNLSGKLIKKKMKVSKGLYRIEDVSLGLYVVEMEDNSYAIIKKLIIS